MRTELSEEAVLRALELHTQYPAPREAIGWEVQRVSDIAAKVREFLLRTGFPKDHEMIRELNAIMLPEAVAEKQPCHFCGATDEKKPKLVVVHNDKPCARCRSATPQTFKAICGDPACPHKTENER